MLVYFEHFAKLVFSPKVVVHGKRDTSVTQYYYHAAIFFRSSGSAVSGEKYFGPRKREHTLRFGYIKYHLMFSFYFAKPGIGVRYFTNGLFSSRGLQRCR